MSAAPPGWYAQPDGSSRYWDGTAWSHPTLAAGPQDRPYAAPQAYAHPYSSQHSYPGDPSPQPYPGQHSYLGQHPYPAQPGLAYQPYAVVPVAPKNPGLALICSFFIPGLGSMINGEVGKGVAFLLLYLISWPLMLILIGFPMALGVWIWGMIDAYQGAQNWNRRHGIWS